MRLGSASAAATRPERRAASGFWWRRNRICGFCATKNPRHRYAIRIDSTRFATTADALRAVRRRTGLSQRAFAEVVGTSGPTVAAYESGAKEPRLSTMQRLAEHVDVRITISAEPLDAGEQLRQRRHRRGRALAAALADAVERDYPRAARLAERNLRRMHAVVGDNAGRRWLDAWQVALDDGPAAVRSALLDPGEDGDELRSMNPFAGLLDEDARRAVLAAAKELA